MLCCQWWIIGWDESSCLVHVWYSSWDEGYKGRIVQMTFTRLCCMIYAAKWSTDMNESMCIHQNHKRWWVMRFWKCRGALHNNTLLEQVISQEIYRRRPICYRLRCMPSVWLMSEDVWRLKVYLVVVVLICNTRSYIIEEYQVRCFDRWGYLCNGWRTPAIVKPER